MGKFVYRNGLVRPLLFGAATTGFALLLGLSAEAQVGITINGNSVDILPEPITQAGRVFVPLRGVFENLGASVVYANGQINATGDGNEISLWIGSTDATVNGSRETIDVAPFIVGESTYVPLRFVSQALGAEVSWNGAEQIVDISTSSDGTNGEYSIGEPPPPLPEYEPPPAPEGEDHWEPGYWAWSSAGYYWVPGTWVPAPQPGFLWTPGYWSEQGERFGWHPGYWGRHCGFYGGVDYGGGYSGHGFDGDRWSEAPGSGGSNRSYNGGPGGIAARPTALELAIARGPHLAMTPLQRQHTQAASQDRRFLASVNGGKPPIAAVPHPFTVYQRPHGFMPLRPQDQVNARRLILRAAPLHRPVTHHAMAPVSHPLAHHPGRSEPFRVAPQAIAPAYHPVAHHALPPAHRTITPDAPAPLRHPVAHHAMAPAYHPVAHHVLPPASHTVSPYNAAPVRHPLAHHEAPPVHHPIVNHTPEPQAK